LRLPAGVCITVYLAGKPNRARGLVEAARGQPAQCWPLTAWPIKAGYAAGSEPDSTTERTMIVRVTVFQWLITE